MKKNVVVSLLMALASLTIQAQIVCHIEGQLMSNEHGNEILICEEGTDPRIQDDPSMYVKADKDGKFSKTIVCDHIARYGVYLSEEYGNGYYAPFFVENATVRVKMYPGQEHQLESDGEETIKMQTYYDLRKHYWDSISAIYQLFREHEQEYYTADFLNTRQQIDDAWKAAQDPKIGRHTNSDSLINALRQLWARPDRFTPQGQVLHDKQMALRQVAHDFENQYMVEHPMLESLYLVLDAYAMLDEQMSAGMIDYDRKPYEQLVSLYHDKLVNFYPGHPIHDQIAIAAKAFNSIQPGKRYIDYNVRNNDGELVPISSLIKGRVALIDLWASWCGPCRRHSVAMIPVYEKYKDLGFTVVAIAREKDRKDMERAVRHDGYPWESLLELKDENQVWFKNGAGDGGGMMILVDRDGTVLSTSDDAKELESLIRKALNID